MGERPQDWGQRRTLLAAVLLVMIPSLIAIFVAPFVPDELRKALYAGAVTLFFAGLRVQLRNVTRALEQRVVGIDEEARIDEETREEITRRVRQMEAYLETLTCEFRDNYKPLSDKQRSYEERTKVILKRFAEAEGSEATPDLPGFVWDSIARLEKLSDFIGEAKEYRAQFETPLDDASEWLRDELARILSSKSRVRPHVGTQRSSTPLNMDAPPQRRAG